MADRKYPPEWDGYYPCDRMHHDKMVEWVDMVMHDPENAGPPPAEWLWMHLRRHTTDPSAPPVPRAKKLMKSFGVTRHRARTALLDEPIWKPTPGRHPSNTGPTPEQHPRPSTNADNGGRTDTTSTPGRHPTDTGANTGAFEESREKREERRDSKNSYGLASQVCGLWVKIPEAERHHSGGRVRGALVSCVANIDEHKPLATDQEVVDLLRQWHEGEPFGVHVVRAARDVLADLDGLEAEDRNTLREACTAMWDPGQVLERLGAA